MGKVYVGQTRMPIMRRWWEHCYSARIGDDKILYRAIRKYGELSFGISVLCQCDSKEELDEMEYHYIRQYMSFKDQNGYNMTYGGEGSVGYTHSDEIRKKMSKKRRSLGLFWSKNANYGNSWSQEQRAELSSRKKGLNAGEANPAKRPEVRARISHSKMGSSNPNAVCWRLISPTGQQLTIHGGIKRELKKYGLDYQSIWTKYGGQYKGWTLLKEGKIG